MAVCDDEKQKLITLCSDYLSNDWRNVDFNDVFCERIPYGICNKTYRCYIKSKKNSELNDVIIHIFASGVFGEENLSKHLGEVSEVAIMQKLFELGMAPKLFAVFPGGRIEAYIPSRPPTSEEYASVDISKAIIRKLAEYHSLDSMPILKKPHLIDKVYNTASKVKFTDEMIAKYTEEEQIHCRSIMKFPLETEYKWIKQILPKIGHKLVFSHNDMNPNNILIKDQIDDSIDKRIILIDYETNTYFYRGFDIVYFLNLKSQKMKSDGKKVTVEAGELDIAFRDEILNEYLKEAKKLDENNFDPKYDNLERLRMEVDFFDLVYNFCAISFGVSIVAQCTLTFPLDRIARRASEYEVKKNSLVQKYGDPTEWK